jgi:hypothetical protein
MPITAAWVATPYRRLHLLSDTGVGERQKVGGHAAFRTDSCICGWNLNLGYHRRKVPSSSSFRTFVRVCSSKWAPRKVQCICCFLTNRLLTT